MRPTKEEILKASKEKTLFDGMGRRIEIVCSKKRGAFPLVGLVYKDEEVIDVNVYCNNGRFTEHNDDKDFDLKIKSPRNVDWEKVMKHGGYGVDVLVRDCDDDSWEKAKLCGFQPGKTLPFVARHDIWGKCKFPDEFEIPENWLEDE